MSGTPIIIESLFLIVSMVAFSAFAAVYTTNSSLISDLQRNTLSMLRERYQTDVKIVLAHYDAELGVVKIYVKNVGLRDIGIGELRIAELYLISSQRIELYSYSDSAGPGSWSYVVVNEFDIDGKWSRGETIEIVAVPRGSLLPGDYAVRLVLYNGFSTDGYFSV